MYGRWDKTSPLTSWFGSFCLSFFKFPVHFFPPGVPETGWGTHGGKIHQVLCKSALVTPSDLKQASGRIFSSIYRLSLYAMACYDSLGLLRFAVVRGGLFWLWFVQKQNGASSSPVSQFHIGLMKSRLDRREHSSLVCHCCTFVARGINAKASWRVPFVYSCCLASYS